MEYVPLSVSPFKTVGLKVITMTKDSLIFLLFNQTDLYLMSVNWIV